MGIENLEKLVWVARILRSSGQGLVNWADFAQFTVSFESSIYHGVNWKIALQILHYLWELWAFWLLGRCTWIFNCAHVRKWHGFCVIHNLKHKNTFISNIAMSINGKTTCILLPAIEAVCT